MDVLYAAFATAGLLLVGGTVGTLLQNSHFNNLRKRERLYRKIPVLTYANYPADWQVEQAGLVSASVVVSLDYFRSFVGMLRALLGGRIRAWEPLLERGRREAVLRLVEDARRQGFDALINVRLQTAQLASRAGGSTQGTAGIEVLAFGTGVRRRRVAAEVLAGGTPVGRVERYGSR